MPFLPPPTEEIDSEITCTLVFYPSGDAYRRALFGNLAELTEAWNWEASKADQLAIRQVWLTAYLQTLECNDMGCLDDVLALLEEIRDHEWCCETVSDVPGGDEITGVDDSTLPPDIDRDGEEFPDGWIGGAETYDPYLCGQAHRLAETTDGAVDAVADTILLASNVVVFATLVILAFGNVIGMGIAAILAGGYTLVTASEIFGFFSAFTELRELLGAGDPQGKIPLTKSEMSAAYDDIVQAIYCSNDAASAITAMDAVIDANVTTSSYAALLKLTYRIATRPIFWGFGGAPDRFDCSCAGIPIGSWDWGTSRNGWDGWATGGAGSNLDTTFMYRFTYGTYTSRTFTVSPSATQLTIVLNGQNNAVGSANVRINARDGSGAAALLDQKTNAMLELNPQDHTYVLDISGKTQNNIWVMIEKITGDTNGRTPIFTGSGEYI